MNHLTKEEAIKAVGVEAVDMVDNMKCFNSGRVLDNPDMVELIAIIDLPHSEYDTLTAFYHQDWNEVRYAEDLGNLGWEVHGYKID